jgi:hypothetical protein
MKRSLSLCLFLVCVLTAAVFAGSNPDAKVAIHVRAHSAKAGCTLTPTISSCSDIVTTLASDNVDAFIVFYDLTSYTGCSYSLRWPAAWGSAALTSCSDLDIGTITLPDSTQYKAHTWTSCQVKSICVAGFLWIYSNGPGYIRAIEPANNDLGLQMLDCGNPKLLDWVHKSCRAGLSGATGDTNCDCPDIPEATVPTRWGEIKSLFE